MHFVDSCPRPRRFAAAAIVLLVAALLARAPHAALAFSASGPVLSNGSGAGIGSTTTNSGPGASVSVSLQGAKANATYAVYACISLVTGGFDCIGRNNPPAFSQIFVAPKALAPITVTLVQQGALTTDANGNGSTIVSLQALLLPDTAASIYNVVQLVNQADMTDSYTGLDLQAPVQPVAGTNGFFFPSVTLALGTPVYIFTQFPGYAYPVAVTTINGLPFVPFFTVPFNTLGLFPFGFTFANGLCPNGAVPVAHAGLGGTIFFSC
ncbi:MAG: hypothetical protein ACYDCQ_08485 [Dehalococcoidia bacterium]